MDDLLLEGLCFALFEESHRVTGSLTDVARGACEFNPTKTDLVRVIGTGCSDRLD